jgi:hypothetical protein
VTSIDLDVILSIETDYDQVSRKRQRLDYENDVPVKTTDLTSMKTVKETSTESNNYCMLDKHGTSR